MYELDVVIYLVFALLALFAVGELVINTDKKY